jgi:hypothetical protein
MGMHFGVVAADVPSAKLIEAFDALAPRFSDRGPLASLDELYVSGENEWELAAGDVNGHGCIVDGTFILSSDADLLVRVAAATEGLVIGCGAETVSGTFYLVAARGHELLRHYFHCNADLARPYSSGNPLPGESTSRLDDIDGGGMLAVLAAHRIDYEAWLARAAKRKVSWSSDYLEQGDGAPWKGAAEAALERHRTEHRLATGKAPPIKVEVRVAPAPVKKPWWRFW